MTQQNPNDVASGAYEDTTTSSGSIRDQSFTINSSAEGRFPHQQNGQIGVELEAGATYEVRIRTVSGDPDCADHGSGGHNNFHKPESDWSSVFTETVENVPNAPRIDNRIPDQTATVGTAFSYVFPANTFSDPDNDPLSYTAELSDGSALPSWLSFTSATRSFSGIPTSGGTISVKVTASDGSDGEGSISDAFDIAVNAAPTVANAIPDQIATVGIEFSYAFPANTFADADNDTLSYTAEQSNGSALPSWLSFASSTRGFSGTPQSADADAGTVSVLVTATDGKGGTVSDTFDIAVNTAPTVANAIPDQVATAGTAFSYVVPADTFSDTDGDALSFSAELSDGGALPAWLTFAASSRSFSGTPTSGGTISVKVTASDGRGGTVSDTFDIAVNSVPTVANEIPDQTATVDSAFSYAFPANTFSDSDSDTLSYTAELSDGSPLPSWLTFTASSRSFSGTPTSGGTMSVKVTASDGRGGSVSDTFDIAANTVPTVANEIPDQTATVGSAFSYAFLANTFADADSDSLSYTAELSDGSPLPSWLTFTASSRSFAGTPISGGTVSVKVTASDGRGGTVSDTFDIAVNTVPTVENEIPDQTATVGSAFSFAFPANTFADADSDSLSYTAELSDGSPLPSWLTFTAASRNFSGTPTSGGTISVKVTASDGKGATVSDTFDIAVNTVPTVANEIPDQTATVGSAFSYAFPANTFADADNDTLSYTAEQSDGNALPSWLSFTPSTRSFAGTPQSSDADAGTVSVRVTASDGRGGTVSDTFDIAMNTAPTVANAVPNQVATVGAAFSYVVPADTFSDTDGDALSFTAELSDGSALPSWLTFTASSRSFAGTPTSGGTISVKVTASDGRGGTVSDTFDIAVNTVPTVANEIPDQVATVGIAFSYAFPTNTFSDADGDTLSYSAELSDGSGLPSWMRFDASSRSFTGTPTSGGTISVKVTASDGKSGTVSDSFDIAVNTVPTVANEIPDQVATVGIAFSYAFPTNTFTDADSDPLSFTAEQSNGSALPSWLSFTAATRNFTGTPQSSDADAGTVSVRVTASDGRGGTVSDTFDVAVNTAPTVANAIPDQVATVGSAFNYAFPANSFADADNDTLSYTAELSDGSALPSWLTFTAAPRSFTGTPQSSDADAGKVSVKVTASDSRGGTVSDTFDISVNTAPTVANAIPDQVATVGIAFSYTVSANTFADSDNDTLSYTAELSDGGGLPSWLTFAPATRSFTGTPQSSDADAGTVSVRVTASDGRGGTVSDTFDIAVNTAPTVANAIPDQVATVGIAFSYVVPANTFSDSDGDALSYTAELSDGSALPSWLRFTATTRSFAGTPTSGGTISVKVTASDGKGGTVNDTFDIAVNTVPTVANAIPDQVATVGSAFSYAFPTNTFSDADRDTLKYAAELSDGSVLPSWLTFAASSRRFAGTPTSGGTISVKVTASDGRGGTVSDTFDIAVNTVPTVANEIPDQTATVGSAFSYAFPANTFADADNDALIYTAELSGGGALPSWLRFTASSRSFSGTPTSGGTISVKVTASDGRGGTVSDTFDIAVNTVPTVANEIPDQTATVGSAFSYAFPTNTFTDADSDTLSYSAEQSNGSTLPSWLTFTASSRSFSGTPTSGGTISVRVTARDGRGGTVSDNFDIAVNTVPTVANEIPDQTATVGSAFSYAFPTNTFSDADSDTLSYTAELSDGSPLPSWLTFTASSRNFSGTPTSGGTISVKVTASDRRGGSVSDTFDIAVNTVPTVANEIPDQTATVDVAFSYTFPTNTFSDADSDTLSYTAELSDGSPLPSWLMFTASSRSFSGTPTSGGTISVKVTASDRRGGSVSDTFDIAVNTVPTVANEIPDQTAIVDVAFSYAFPTNTFSDADSDTLSYTAELSDGSPLPSWLTFTAASRSFTVTPTSGGTTSVKVTASDGRGGSVSDTFDIVVNTVPTVANEIPDQTATVDIAFSYTFPANTFADADSDTLRYTAEQSDGSPLPSWLSFTPDTRSFAGTPQSSDADAGSVSVQVTASDGRGGTVSETFDIAVNTAPTVADEVPDQAATVGEAFSYVVPANTFEDADRDTLSYTAELSDGSELPSWLSFNPATRSISGTPTSAARVSVMVTASDGKGGTASDTFEIVVNAAGNKFPSASDNAVQTRPNQYYTFQVDDFGFTDSDGDSLAQVKIETWPASGTGGLWLEGESSPIRSERRIGRTDILDGKLEYRPPKDKYGDGFASFTFKVNDGYVDSDAAYTMTIDVINSSPVVSDSSVRMPPRRSPDDPGYVFKASDFRYSDPDGDALSSITIGDPGSLPEGSLLQLNGVNVSAGQEVTIDDLDAGALVFTPRVDAQARNYATFTFKAKDEVSESGEAVMRIHVSNLSSDRVVSAWLSRFGRTAADQAVDAVRSRIDVNRAPVPHGEAVLQVNLAGQDVLPKDPGMSDAPRRSRVTRVTGAMGSDERPPGFSGAGLDAGSAGHILRGHESGYSPRGETWDAGRETAVRVLDVDMLRGSSFSHSSGDAGTSVRSIWGRGTVSSFEGREGALDVDGDVNSLMLGVDTSSSDRVLGVMFSHSWGTGEYSDGKAEDGEIDSSLYGIYPYASHRLNERITIWGTGGYAQGELELKREGEATLIADTDMLMLAGGLRGVWREANGGWPALALVGDGMYVRSGSDAVGDELAKTQTDVSRLRFGMESSWNALKSGEGWLRPSARMNLRHDGGDAEKGLGAELEGSLEWMDPVRGISANVQARGMLMHQEDEYREHSISGSFLWDPRPETQRGATMEISSGLRGSDADVVGRRIEEGVGGTVNVNEGDHSQYWRMDVGYGFGVLGDRFVSIPGFGVGWSENVHEYTLGWQLRRDDSDGFDAMLEVAQQHAEDGQSQHGIGVRIRMRW